MTGTDRAVFAALAEDAQILAVNRGTDKRLIRALFRTRRQQRKIGL